MAMKTTTTMTQTPIMKCLWMVFMVMLLVAFTQPDLVHCRTLRSTGGPKDDEITTAPAGCEGGVLLLDGIHSTTTRLMAPLISVSTKNSCTGGRGSLHSVRNLAFKLASGPSRKGPGH
ncbi:hypothetical protein BVC80_8963g8 [Macleaya cordata]|uniref:Uncharacterized protein n=1 Tax=Macleaya cordata TaxID=56857 RepID=A0A200PUZ6_MACCD|nr:hypothetical protein BVC80_8963g8 [Macleaya cordata]